MPESKKLSELINEFFKFATFRDEIWKTKNHSHERWEKVNSDTKDIQNQIDQKFEELRCECDEGFKIEKVTREHICDCIYCPNITRKRLI